LYLHYYIQTAHSILNCVLPMCLGLILVSEPYYNETGYEKQKNTVLGCENSKKYNEMVLVQLLHVSCLFLYLYEVCDIKIVKVCPH